MAKRVEFRLAGSGGQGVISAGIILASAAVMDGRHAIQSQSYGPEARGGTSKAEVVISDGVIDYPKATMPDYILCLTDEAFEAYGKDAPENATVFVDSTVQVKSGQRPVLSVPIVETASRLNPQGANVVAVGFMVGYTGVVSRDAAVEALNELFPRFVEKNKACVNAGFEYADQMKKA